MHLWAVDDDGSLLVSQPQVIWADADYARKQLLEFIFTSSSHVWSNGDKDTVPMWTVTPETSPFEPFPDLLLSL